MEFRDSADISYGFFCFSDYEPPTVVQCHGPDNYTIWSSGPQTDVTWLDPLFVDNSGQPITMESDKKPGVYRIGECC